LFRVVERDYNGQRATQIRSCEGGTFINRWRSKGLPHPRVIFNGCELPRANPPLRKKTKSIASAQANSGKPPQKLNFSSPTPPPPPNNPNSTPKPKAHKAAPERQGGMRLAALARGGAGRASLSGGEMRTVRDWEQLEDEQAAAAAAAAGGGHQGVPQLPSARSSSSSPLLCGYAHNPPRPTRERIVPLLTYSERHRESEICASGLTV